jgi:thiol:disulfide interchange protein DsbD
VSCHVIEREVFGDPRVAARLARMQVLRPDVTANDVQARQLMRDWAVVGPPTLLLVAPDGRERRALRTVGEISATQFLDRLEQAGAGEEA